MKHTTLFCLASTLLCLGACENKTPDQNKAPDKTPDKKVVKTTPKTAVPKTTPQAPVKTRPAIEDTKLQAIFETWLKAQNEGKFDQYDQLYAKRMTGIKRIGTKSYKYNRASWLKDRNRMFKKKMTVQAKDIKMSATPQSAIISFTQIWASGKYKDEGPKQLLVVKEGDQLKIAREEMLSSNIKSSKTGTRLPVETFAFVKSYDQGKFSLILDLNTKYKSKGGIKLRKNSRTTTSKIADESTIDQKYLALKGKEFKVFGPKGELCTATVDGFRLLKFVTLHFGQYLVWDEEKTPVRRQANQLWNYEHNTTPHLIATLKTSKDCTGARFAVSSDKPAPTIFPKTKSADAKLVSTLTGAFKKTPAYTKLEKKNKGWWDKKMQSLQIFSYPKDPNRTLIYFDEYAICDEPSYSVNQVWDAQKKGDKTTLIDQSQEKLGIFEPQDMMAVDLDQDGVPELISSSHIFKLNNGTYQLIDQVKSYYFDCPC